MSPDLDAVHKAAQELRERDEAARKAREHLRQEILETAGTGLFSQSAIARAAGVSRQYVGLLIGAAAAAGQFLGS